MVDGMAKTAFKAPSGHTYLHQALRLKRMLKRNDPRIIARMITPVSFVFW